MHDEADAARAKLEDLLERRATAYKQLMQAAGGCVHAATGKWKSNATRTATGTPARPRQCEARSSPIRQGGVAWFWFTTRNIHHPHSRSSSKMGSKKMSGGLLSRKTSNASVVA